MRWSVVVPVFNERELLPRTIASLLAQTETFRLIVVDNGSTDGCIDSARRQVADAGGVALFLGEATPGQVHALQRGIDAVESEFVAICDADTWYPPHYLERAGELFDECGERCVMLGAWLRREGSSERGAARDRLHRLGAARLWPRQNHTSGAAQLFRTTALREAGGYDPEAWPYVLKDHELAHRVMKLGAQHYDRDLWCISSSRRADRSHARWNLGERLLYHATPTSARDWFFYRFLAKRFAARGLRDTVLRHRPWEGKGA